MNNTMPPEIAVNNPRNAPHPQVLPTGIASILILVMITTIGCGPGSFNIKWDESCDMLPKLLFSSVTEQGETVTIVVTNKGKSGGNNADCAFDLVFRQYQDLDNDAVTANVLAEVRRITVLPGEMTAVLKGSHIYSVHIENATGGTANNPRSMGQAELDV